MKTIKNMQRALFIVLSLVFIASCSGGTQKTAEANVDLGNNAIAKMNDISTNQLPPHGIFLRMPETSKQAVKGMTVDELTTVEGLLKDYIHQGQVVQYTSSQANVSFTSGGDVSALISGASEILNAVEQQIATLQNNQQPQTE